MFRNKKLILWSGIVVCCVVVAVALVRKQYMLPIVMYHSILPSVPADSPLVVSAKTFERQMSFLKNNKYAVLSLDQAAAQIAQRKKAIGRVVVLTFDDGYVDNYLYAFPILKKYGLQATIFLIVGEIGKPGKLDMDQILEMQDSGLITFGSHSMSHPFLDSIKSAPELVKEISSSKKVLEGLLGKPVAAFAYPLGRLNKDVRQRVIDAGYRIAVTTNPGKSIHNNDIFVFKRLRISENAGNLFVFWFETSGYYNIFREVRQHKK